MMVDIFREVLCSDQETGRFEKKPGELIGRYANGLYEHSCSVFIFVNMSSDQFCHTSSEYFTKHRWQGEVSFSLAGISLLLKSCFAASNLTDTSTPPFGNPVDGEECKWISIVREQEISERNRNSSFMFTAAFTIHNLKWYCDQISTLCFWVYHIEFQKRI